MKAIPFDTTAIRLIGGARRRRSLRLWAIQAAHLLREWRERRRTRAALAEFDNRLLLDIGISRGEAEREINKPFWRK